MEAMYFTLWKQVAYTERSLLLCFLSLEDDQVESETNSFSDFPISSIPS